VPAGVPVPPPEGVAVPPEDPHPEIIATQNRISKGNTANANGREWNLFALPRCSSNIHTPIEQRTSRNIPIGRIGADGRGAGGSNVCAVVEIVRVVAPDALPDATPLGLNDAVEFGGKFDAEKVTAEEREPPCVARLIAKFADCPAVIVCGCTGPEIVKSAAVIVVAFQLAVRFATLIEPSPVARSKPVPTENPASPPERLEGAGKLLLHKLGVATSQLETALEATVTSWKIFRDGLAAS